VELLFIFAENYLETKYKIMAIEVTDATFDEVVLQAGKPVIVDFWAAWCGPCRMLHPIIDEIEKELGDKIVIAKVDVDNNQEYAAKYGVRNIPTVLIFKGGEIAEKQVGVAPKSVYLDKLNALL
jgi:thioredoxin 1